MSSIKVVKIGGNVVDNPEALDRFLDDFVKLPGKKILVHGGGKEATRLSTRLDIPTTMIEGKRVTDAATLEVVAMVYAGLVNKRIVSKLQARGCNAIGLTGADADVIEAVRRPAAPIDYGYVGDVDAAGVNSTFISGLLDECMVPVFCAIMHNGEGTLLNCNADSVARAVATGMAMVEGTALIYCFEKEGVLRNVDDPSSLIYEMDRDYYRELRDEGIINKGMIPKLDNAFSAIDKGVDSVTICHSDNLLTCHGTTLR